MSQNDYIKDITFKICNRPCGSLYAWDDWGHSVSVTELGLEFQSSHPHSWVVSDTSGSLRCCVCGKPSFPYCGFRGVCSSLARLTRAMFFPPSLSLMNLWLSLPPKTLPITFPAWLEIHGFCMMWWGLIQSGWLIDRKWVSPLNSQQFWWPPSLLIPIGWA